LFGGFHSFFIGLTFLWILLIKWKWLKEKASNIQKSCSKDKPVFLYCYLLLIFASLIADILIICFHSNNKEDFITSDILTLYSLPLNSLKINFVIENFGEVFRSFKFFK